MLVRILATLLLYPSAKLVTSPYKQILRIAFQNTNANVTPKRVHALNHPLAAILSTWLRQRQTVVLLIHANAKSARLIIQLVANAKTKSPPSIIVDVNITNARVDMYADSTLQTECPVRNGNQMCVLPAHAKNRSWTVRVVMNTSASNKPAPHPVLHVPNTNQSLDNAVELALKFHAKLEPNAWRLEATASTTKTALRRNAAASQTAML